jgi:hypothetical protein
MPSTRVQRDAFSGDVIPLTRLSAKADLSLWERGPALRPEKIRKAELFNRKPYQAEAMPFMAAASVPETGFPSLRDYVPTDPLRGPPSPAEGGGRARGLSARDL